MIQSKYLFLLTMLMSMVGLTASAQRIPHGTEVDGLNYFFNDDNMTASVTYQYIDYDKEYESGYYQYSNYYGSIDIPCSVNYNGKTYSVTSIGGGAFCDCGRLTSVTIPNSVTSICSQAFENCSRLTSVTIGNNVVSIEMAAFNLSSLTEIICLPEMPPCANDAFNNYLYSITTLKVPQVSLEWYKTTPPWNKFNKIVGISDIHFADPNVQTLCLVNWDTDGDGHLSYEEASAVTDLGEVFMGKTDITSFNELQYFTGLTTIGTNAFKNCTGLTSITIPNSVTTIDESAFYKCRSLTSITIPNSVKTIGNYVFYDCAGLISATIGNGMTSIGEQAFKNCSGLTSITIPNNVTSIGSRAFQGCTGLTSVKVDDGNAVYDSRNNCNAIIKTQTNTLVHGFEITVIPSSVTSIGNTAFYGCNGLTSISIPDNVTSIGNSAYHSCTNLATVTIGNGVKSIAKYAFKGCSGLTSVTIGNSVTSIGVETFAGCSNLTEIIALPETPPTANDNTFTKYDIPLKVPRASLASYLTTSPWKNFQTIVGIENGDEPGGEIIVEDENHITFADMKVRTLCVANWDTDGNGSLSYEEAAAVTNLGEVFSDNAEITSFNELQYFTGLTYIGDNAFMGCSNLAAVTLPESITSIGAYAFYGCKALTIFTIPQGVSEIGAYAFRGCTGLTNVYCLPLDVPTTASNAFNNSNIGNATLHVIVSSFDAYKNAEPWKNFKNMKGDIPVPCAIPTISYVEGKIVFTCETEDVEFVSNISSTDMGDYNSSEIDICAAYDITVYATKAGYNPSETATATLCWIDSEPIQGVATGIMEIPATPVLIKSNGGVITVEGLADGTQVTVYTVNGAQVATGVSSNRMTTINTSLSPGTITIVKMGGKSVKIVVR